MRAHGKTATFLRGATAAAALLAGAGSAHAQGAPGAGGFPGSILIPGTNTSFKMGGYIKGDYIYDMSAQQNIIPGLHADTITFDNNAGSPGTKPGVGHSIHGTSQFTAAESRFNIETRTPTDYGEFKTFIEGDFENPSGLTNSATFQINSNSAGFRLRYAYGTLGPWLIGQYNSTFRDIRAEAETLDFNGPLAAGPARQPIFRFTYDAGDGLTIAVAAENPQAFWTDANNAAIPGGATSTAFGTGQGDKIPDFATAATFNFPQGHVALRGIFRDIYDHNGGPGAGLSNPGTNVSVSKFGWGLGLSGDLHTWGKDDIIAQVNGGDGVGRYMDNFSALSPDAVVNSVTHTMKTISAWGVLLGYQHWWTESLRTNLVGAYVKEEHPSGIFTPAALAEQGNEWWTTYANLIWSPVPQIDTGIEYSHATRRIVNGQEGNINRIQVSTKLKF